MRDIDHIRAPGYLAAMKQIGVNAKQPERITWTKPLQQSSAQRLRMWRIAMRSRSTSLIIPMKSWHGKPSKRSWAAIINSAFPMLGCSSRWILKTCRALRLTANA